MPRPKDHVVVLSGADRMKLTRVITRGSHPARTIMRARVLLELDESTGVGSSPVEWCSGSFV